MPSSKDLNAYPDSFWLIPKKLLVGPIELQPLTYREAIGLRTRFHAWRALLMRSEARNAFPSEELNRLATAIVRVEPLQSLEPRGEQRLRIDTHGDSAMNLLNAALADLAPQPLSPLPMKLPPIEQPNEPLPSSLDEAIDAWMGGGEGGKK